MLLQLQVCLIGVLAWLVIKEDGREISIATINWGCVPPWICCHCRVWIDLVEDLRESNIVNSMGRLSRSFRFLRPLLWEPLWLVQSDATGPTGLLLRDCWLASLSQVLLDELVKVVQILLDLDLLVNLDGLFQAFLDLFCSLSTLNELVNARCWLVLLWFLVQQCLIIDVGFEGCLIQHVLCSRITWFCMCRPHLIMPYLLLYQLGQLVYLINEASWLRGPVALVGGCVWHRLLMLLLLIDLAAWLLT